MKKIILILAIICQICAVAQEEKDFKQISILDGTGLYSASPTSDYMYIPTRGIYCMDKKHNALKYGNEEISELYDEYAPGSTISVFGIKHWKDNIYWAALNKGGFLVFRGKTDTSDMEILHQYNSKNVKNFLYFNIPINDGIEVSDLISGFCFDKTGEYVYYMTEDDVLIKMKTNNPDTIEYGVNTTLILEEKGYALTWVNYRDFHIDENDNIWFATCYKHIPMFNTTSREYTFFDSTCLPVPTRMKAHPYDNTQKELASLFNLCDIHVLPEKHNYVKIGMGKYGKGYYDSTAKKWLPHCTNKILKYEDGVWDTIPVPYEMLVKKIDGETVQAYALYDKIFQWTEDEIAFDANDIYPYEENGLEGNRKRKMLIYNLATKKWSEFVFPFHYSKVRAIPSDVEIWNGKYYFLFYPTFDNATKTYFSPLYSYEPGSNIEEPETEEGIFADLWISDKNVYPNPTNTNLTVNITYYPQAGDDLQVGLYNSLGERKLDLKPLGEYSAAENRFKIKFDIPPNLPRGMYFLNARSGNESRTKGIAIY